MSAFRFKNACYRKQFVVICADASSCGIGAVISQQSKDIKRSYIVNFDEQQGTTWKNPILTCNYLFVQLNGIHI